MSETKLGRESAFPCFKYNEAEYEDCIVLQIDGIKQFIPFEKGINKRFYAACAAMQGILANEHINPNGIMPVQDKIKLAYVYADELLKQE